MGWASGSELAEGIWDDIKDVIPEKKKKKVARKIIERFQDNDCDTMDECEELQEAAELPQECWECGREFAYGKLDENGLCIDCDE